VRYRLDDLGWFDFEALVQSLLKAHLGLRLEAWGGHSDLGRDAFSRGPLRFPRPDVEQEGPYIFQVKFVQGANAAGARPAKALLDAVTGEIERRSKRRAGRSTVPRWYVLITNVPLTSSLRGSIESLLHDGLAGVEVLALGASDVCALLDQYPALRRSFPELLGLRDLDALLYSVVNRVVIQRSAAALEEARDLAPVFVATAPYHRAWQVPAAALICRSGWTSRNG